MSEIQYGNITSIWVVVDHLDPAGSGDPTQPHTAHPTLVVLL